jgi:hypothetical protein
MNNRYRTAQAVAKRLLSDDGWEVEVGHGSKQWSLPKPWWPVVKGVSLVGMRAGQLRLVNVSAESGWAKWAKALDDMGPFPESDGWKVWELEVWSLHGPHGVGRGGPSGWKCPFLLTGAPDFEHFAVRRRAVDSAHPGGNVWVPVQIRPTS